MTPTDKQVSRVTTGEFASRVIGQKRRRIAITILPGDTLLLRLFGTQQREYVSIKDVFEIARCMRVRSERMQKVNFKRRAKRLVRRSSML